MRISGRLAAAIDILSDFDARPAPLKTALADWGRANRYAGAKDRAWISGLCLDVLRRRPSLAAYADGDAPRSVVFAAYRALWGAAFDALADAADGPHGPGPLTATEVARFEGAPALDPGVFDAPAWIRPLAARVFGDDAVAEIAALSARAPVDLRANTLKTSVDKASSALTSVNAERVSILETALRVPAANPSERAPAVTVIPAFNKGWVEVQDLGSQIAAAAAGAVAGAQVLDYCAGGGGKTLALAALMNNTGQLYAYDSDARRLAGLFQRAQRAGLRNVQIRSPADGADLSDFAEKMDVVFVDAPCTGSGTWRRKPDAKWRVSDKQLARRQSEQDAVLREARAFVKPGGALVWATCSFLAEENEDRLDAFLRDAPDFARTPTIDAVAASGVLATAGAAALAPCVTADGALRLTPRRIGADGFYIATLRRAQG